MTEWVAEKALEIESESTKGYVDVQIVQSCREVFAIRENDGSVLLDNFVTFKTYQINSSLATNFEFINTTCPENESSLDSANYKCLLAVLSSNVGTIYLIEFNAMSYDANDSLRYLDILQTRVITPAINVPN